MYKILIASDSTLDRDHLTSACTAHDLCIAGDAYSCEDAIALSELHSPHVVIFNFKSTTRNQTQTIARILKNNKSTKVLIYSSANQKRSTWPYIRAGASAFIQEELSAEELTSIIRGIIAGFTLVPMKTFKQPKTKLAHRHLRNRNSSSPTTATLPPNLKTPSS